MGQGDMLFLPPGQSKLVRAQGTMVEEHELRKVLEFVKRRGRPDYHPELVRLQRAEQSSSGERDELFDEAVEIILASRRGSVSLLQRRLTIGYSRASRLIDQMADAGIVGEYKGSQAREVLMTEEEWETIRTNRDREEREEAGRSEVRLGQAAEETEGQDASAPDATAEAADEAVRFGRHHIVLAPPEERPGVEDAAAVEPDQATEEEPDEVEDTEPVVEDDEAEDEDEVEGEHEDEDEEEEEEKEEEALSPAEGFEFEEEEDDDEEEEGDEEEEEDKER